MAVPTRYCAENLPGKYQSPPEALRLRRLNAWRGLGAFYSSRSQLDLIRHFAEMPGAMLSPATSRMPLKFGEIGSDMEQRSPSRLTRDLSVIGLGTWQLGADWGDVEDEAATAVLDAARSAGVTFFDTADVYGDGRSEKFIGNYMKNNGSEKIGRASCRERRQVREERV